MTTLDLFGQVEQPTATTNAPDLPLAKHTRVEILAGGYAGLTGSVASFWTRPDAQPMCDVALDAGYTVSVRVSGVGRA